jgi:hypothetical protein
MSRTLLVCLLCLLGATACPAFLPAAADSAPLPDLYPDLYFFVGNTTTTGVPAGTPVAVIVYVQNNGPGNITSANVTLYLDGSLLATLPARYNFSGEGLYGIVYTWNTTSVPVGNYTIRAEVNDTAGDADPANNAVQRGFTIARLAPNIKLQLDAAVVITAVTESSPGIATLTGNVTATGLGGQAMNISLAAVVDTGWKAVVSPGFAQADQDGRFLFSAEVTVPQGTSATVYGRLRVSASGRTQNDTLTASAEAIIQVRPYYRFTLYTSTPELDISPGSQAYFRISLTNAGNAVDSYDIGIDNLAQLISKKWTVVLSANTVARVSAGEYKMFSVSAQSPEDWTLSKDGATTIVIRATSEGSENVTLTFPIYAFEKGSYPGWYNWTTISLTAVILAVVVVAAVYVRLRKRKRTGEPGSRGTGDS